MILNYHLAYAPTTMTYRIYLSLTTWARMQICTILVAVDKQEDEMISYISNIISMLLELSQLFRTDDRHLDSVRPL